MKIEHWVKYFYPGSLYSEESTEMLASRVVEIPSVSLHKPKAPDSACGMHPPRQLSAIRPRKGSHPMTGPMPLSAEDWRLAAMTLRESMQVFSQVAGIERLGKIATAFEQEAIRMEQEELARIGREID